MSELTRDRHYRNLVWNRVLIDAAVRHKDPRLGCWIKHTDGRRQTPFGEDMTENKARLMRIRLEEKHPEPAGEPRFVFGDGWAYADRPRYAFDAGDGVVVQVVVARSDDGPQPPDSSDPVALETFYKASVDRLRVLLDQAHDIAARLKRVDLGPRTSGSTPEGGGS